ncbi:MAG: hypothetical protein OJF61_001650 [Rhodanobacteraceae bacterium]|nr:MAG: hypothetical protein OJF61_001650 [Rhodanobacteraceae bacterium]
MGQLQKPDGQKVIEGIGKIFGVFPRIAGVIVGFTALAYMIGWYESKAYYTEIGASWAVELLTASQVMHAGENFIFFSFLSFSVSVATLLRGSGSIRSFIFWQLVFLLLAGLFYVLSQISGLWINHDHRSIFLILSALSFAILIGVSIGEILAYISFGKTIEHSLWADFINFIVIFCLINAPIYLGRGRADLEIVKISSQSEEVCIQDNSCRWHLVGVVGDQLLIAMNDLSKGRVFRVAGPKSLTFISSPSDKSKNIPSVKQKK